MEDNLTGSYTIIGKGRVARHFARYFTLEGIPFRQWWRQLPIEDLRDKTKRSTHVLVLISDRAIESFVETHRFLHAKQLVHFSGSLVTPLAPSAHPLMTFGEKTYSLEWYRKVPFILEKGRGSFQQILPGLSNPHRYLNPDLKPLYHCLCVMGGNFTTLLWEKVLTEFGRTLGLPEEIVYPYLDRICLNVKERETSALTGPLERRDMETVRKNLAALGGDPFRAIYQGFLKAYGLTREEEYESP